MPDVVERLGARRVNGEGTQRSIPFDGRVQDRPNAIQFSRTSACRQWLSHAWPPACVP
jgi:hypothetical protein